MCLPYLGAVFVTGILVHLFQVGILFHSKQTRTGLVRSINPLSGFKKIFSMQGTVTVVQGIFKILSSEPLPILRLKVSGRLKFLHFRSRHSEIAEFVTATCFQLAMKVTALFILALFDYLYQYWRHERV